MVSKKHSHIDVEIVFSLAKSKSQISHQTFMFFEMTQALYAHMNNKKIKIKKKCIPIYPHLCMPMLLYALSQGKMV
jgi:hypothetical protein